MPKRILLLSAYDAVSHRLWRERLQALFPEYDWQQLSLPPRHFTWRIRGNSLQWALQQKTVLRQHYDLIIATSMVDLASLRGLIPQLGSIPTVVYFHENQFFYPPGQQPSTNIEPQLVPVYAALCADQVVFNSNFNRDTFLKGTSSLFNKLPDDLGGAIDLALQSSCVIPVPLDDEEFETVAESEADSHETSLLQVVWNHRWEYDKGPELLLAVAEALLDEALPVCLHVVGQQFRQCPDTFIRLDTVLAKIAQQQHGVRGAFGFITQRQQYLQILAYCDATLSTAAHDFQGLALQEAIALGCTPLAPATLAYPEYLDAEFLYEVESDITATAEQISKRLRHYCQLKESRKTLPQADVSHYKGSVLRASYAALFERMMA